MSGRSSPLLGGIGSPSGVRRPSKAFDAFFSLGLKPRMPSRTTLLSFGLRSDFALRQGSAAHVGSFGIFVLDCRDRDHPAVITLAPQPTEKGAFEQLGVETIGLAAGARAIRLRSMRG